MKSVNEAVRHYPQVRGVHPACESVPLMSQEEFDGLARSVAERGLSLPIMLTTDRLLLDGRHRLLACYETGTEPLFEVWAGDDPWDEVFSLNADRRHLSVGQRAVMAHAFVPHFAVKAKEAQRAGGGDRKTATGKARGSLVSDRTQPKAREEAAARFGVGNGAVARVAVVAAQRPDLIPAIQSNELALDAAYRQARQHKAEMTKLEPVQTKFAVATEKAVILELSGKKREIDRPKNVRLNRTNDNVEWASWTWNPVTGCEHGCPFCYAREIANSERMAPFYPFKFSPALHEYRLDAPRGTPFPADAAKADSREGRVFVCSMADLFGKWVPKEWISKVFDACLAAPDWTYLFLTKWPARYAQMPLLKRAWYGSSVVKQADVARVERAMLDFEAGKGAKKWISLEPMLEPVRFSSLSWCNLVVIGSQTETVQPKVGRVPAFAPKFDWVADVVHQCRDAGVPVYLKPNLGLMAPGMDLPKEEPS